MLARSLDVDGCEVRIHGRADALREDADGLVVEELKSIWVEAPPSEATLRAYRRQLRVYAWMLADAAPAVRAELVLLPIGDGEPERESVAFDEDATAHEVERAARAWLERAHAEVARAQRRAARAHEVRLPHAAFRPGQEALAEAAGRAALEGEQLIVSAPTGLGKTVATLLPLLRDALAYDRRIALLSATTLGQRIGVRTLRDLAPRGLPLAVQLRAKARMCANDRLLCLESCCSFAADYLPRRDAAGLPGALLDSAVLEPDALRARAESVGVCPFELSLDAAREVPVVVCDLNYAFDPVVRALRPGDPELARTVLVVDEVHRLAPRVRESLGVQLDAGDLARAAERTSFGGAPVHGDQTRLLRELSRRIEATVTDAAPGGPPDFEMAAEAPDLSDGLDEALDQVLVATLAYRQATRALEPDDPYLDAWFSLRAWRRSHDPRVGAFATLAGRSGGAARLRRVCLDASPWIGAILGGAHAMIGLSATPGPAELLATELGLARERRAFAHAPDPFGCEQRCVVIDPGIDTTFKRREREVPGIARRLAALADAVPGNTLALLPSFDLLERVLGCLPAQRRSVRHQRRTADETEREALLAELGQRDDLLVLAVAGGVLAESIDPSPGSLRAVAVVGPCLPGMSVERGLLEAHYEEQFGDGFLAAYAVPGMARVVQAAGRLVRRPQDRGVVALFGRRFLREPYRGLLPGSWLAGGAPEDLAGDPARVARAFFERG